MFHFGTDGGGVLALDALPRQRGVLLQNVHRIGQIVVGKAPHLFGFGGVGFDRFHNGAACLFHPVHGGGERRVRQGSIEAVQGIELLLDIGQHGVHVVLPGVERHLVFHHMGRTEFLSQAKRRGSAAQRHQQCPEFVHREHRAEHHEHQSACVKRQDTGFPGADDLAHEASPFPGHSRNLAPFLSIIKLFGKNASVS